MIRGRDGVTNEIKLDFDNRKDLELFLVRAPFVFLKLNLHPKRIQGFLSSSGKGLHVVILIREMLPPFFVVALQVMLGSDFRRETFNLVRVRNLRRVPTFWRSRWNVLYSEKLRDRK